MVGHALGWRRWFAGVTLTTLAGSAAAALASEPNQDVWLEAELQPASLYVQAQAVYHLRFFQAIDVSELQIDGPSARLAQVRQMGEERVSEARRQGQRYRVRERRYAIFPFASGDLALTGAQVRGRVASVAATSDDGRAPLQLLAPTLTLQVRPMPAAAGSGPWLPARQLTLSETWSATGAPWQPGQVLLRTVRVEAVGIDAVQIPPLPVAAPGLLVQAQAPHLENRWDGEHNVGVREQTFALVALRAGTLALPALTLPWWSLTTDAAASARLPPRHWNVLPAHTAPVADRPAAAPASASRPAPAAAASPPILVASKTWLWLALGALFSATLITVGATRPRVRAAWRLHRAGRSADAGALRDALLQWAATRWPSSPPQTLETLAQRLNDPAASRALAALDRCLYGAGPARCDAAARRATVRAVKAGVAPRGTLARRARPLAPGAW